MSFVLNVKTIIKVILELVMKYLILLRVPYSIYMYNEHMSLFATC
jgi:hypothetical protein